LKKVLIITYYWPPSGGAGVQRILKFSKYLAQLGYELFIVTVDENFASYPSFDKTFEKDVPTSATVVRTRTFEPFNAYSRIIGRRSIPTGFSNESNPGLVQKATRFIRGNFFIPDARRGWVRYAVKAASELIRKESIDTVICTSPPHSAQLAGLVLKKKYNIRYIADLRDPWTDIYYYDEFIHLPYAKNIDKCFELKVLERSDAIVTVSDELKKLFLAKSQNISPDKITVIHNGFDEDDFRKECTAAGEDFVISYTGTLADSYGPEVFLRALRKVIQSHTGIKVVLHLIGSPSESVMRRAEELSIANCIRLTPTVSHEKSVEMLFASDALWLLIPRVKDDKGILTGKLFEYLASRKPIIAVGPVDGDAAKIISECNAGKMFSRDQEDQITDYILGLINSKINGSKLHNAFDTFRKYSRRKQAEALAGIIEKIN
jgi:glycosyltransferase involved in cell wall biosynthesis